MLLFWRWSLSVLRMLSDESRLVSLSPRFFRLFRTKQVCVVPDRFWVVGTVHCPFYTLFELLKVRSHSDHHQSSHILCQHEGAGTCRRHNASDEVILREGGAVFYCGSALQVFASGVLALQDDLQCLIDARQAAKCSFSIAAMSATEQLEPSEGAAFKTFVAALEAAIDKIVSNHFGPNGKQAFWDVFKPGIRSKISRWKTNPTVGSTETLINIFEGRLTEIFDYDTWNGYAGTRSLKTSFQAGEFHPLLTELKLLKSRLAKAESEKDRHRTAAAWSVTAAGMRGGDQPDELLGQLIDIYPKFLASLEDALGQGGDHVLDARLRAQFHEQPEMLKRAVSLGKTDAALHFLQSLHFTAFDEQPDNPLGKAMRYGAVAPVLRIMDDLVGPRVADSPHDAPQGNRIPDLLADLEAAADRVLASPALEDAAAYDVDMLRQFARLTLARPRIGDDRYIDISELDRSAWPVRQLYLGSLRRIENLTSQIVGQRLAFAPAKAIFRDELSVNRLGNEAAKRLSQLPPGCEQSWGPEMIKLASGEFLMGACPHDKAARDDERPQHAVVIDQPFALSRFLITNAEYLVYAHAEGIENYSEMRNDPSFPRGGIPFQSAANYCDWLSRLSDVSYRLPSETEWEYACRAGAHGIYWWGDEADPTKANVDRSSSVPTRLGAFPPNPWRLSDIVGNLSEWCADHYVPHYQEPRTQKAMTVPEESEPILLDKQILELTGSFEHHIPVTRGGSHGRNWLTARMSNRNPIKKIRRANSIGLRVARTLHR